MNAVVKLPKALLTVVLAMLGACEGAGPGTVELAGELAGEPDQRAAHALVGQIMAIAEQPGDAARLLEAIDFTALLALAVASPTTSPPLAPPPLAWPLASSSTDGAADGSGDGSGNALAGCLLAAGTAATLTECELGDHVIDGTWSMQHQRVHAELVDVFTAGDGGRRGSLWIDANLPAGVDVPIEGSIEVSLMWTTAGHDHALDASLRVEGLVVEGPACATAGTITINGRLTNAANTTTTVWFGPTCRDIHISRHTSR